MFWHVTATDQWKCVYQRRKQNYAHAHSQVSLEIPKAINSHTHVIIESIEDLTLNAKWLFM